MGILKKKIGMQIEYYYRILRRGAMSRGLGYSRLTTT
jgi:hypothetical protein